MRYNVTDACGSVSRRAGGLAHDLDHNLDDVRRRNLDGAAALAARQETGYTLCLWYVSR